MAFLQPGLRLASNLLMNFSSVSDLTDCTWYRRRSDCLGFNIRHHQRSRQLINDGDMVNTIEQLLDKLHYLLDQQPQLR